MIQPLFSLNRAPSRNKTNGKAPHKPVLLLALIQEIDKGRIQDNKVFIKPELIASFKEIWSRLVVGRWNPKFFLPFYHLSNDTPQFWFLKTKPGASILLTSKFSPKSVGTLTDAIDYAYFSDDLWKKLSDPITREKIRTDLVSYYFPNKSFRPDDVEVASEIYKKQLELGFYSNQAADWLPDKYEKEAVRSTLFKTEIPKIYNYTCAISRQRIISSDGTQMIDACHIRPWSETKDDSIQNGIALTPTIHRAFDRGLISITWTSYI